MEGFGRSYSGDGHIRYDFKAGHTYVVEAHPDFKLMQVSFSIKDVESYYVPPGDFCGIDD
jgi:hypothetical protein